MENRPDGGPVTRSRNQITSNVNETNFDYYSAEAMQAIKLISTFELMNPIQLFENRIKKLKPANEIERRHQMAMKSREIIRKLDSEQRTALRNSLEKESQK